VANAISSILVSQVALGSHEIMVGECRLSVHSSRLLILTVLSVHHTDCGMSKYTDPTLREALSKQYSNDTARPYGASRQTVPYPIRR
jgi:hypothetical protein